MTNSTEALSESNPIDLIFDKNKVGGVYPFYKYCGRGMHDDLERFILENRNSRDKKTMSDVEMARVLLHSYRDFKSADPLPRKKEY